MTCTCEVDPDNVLPRTRFDYANLRSQEQLDVVVSDEIALGDGLHRELVVRVYDATIDFLAEGWVDVILEGLAPSPVPTTDVYSTGTLALVRIARPTVGALLRMLIGWDAPAFGRLHVVMHRATTAPGESIELAVDVRRAARLTGGSP